ncbi:MAG: hypothetical protein E6Q85_01055 [Thiothrix sp.]|nr:MAG: hypothetical protein E6Q85_01055 [Thiothrix sp.]
MFPVFLSLLLFLSSSFTNDTTLTEKAENSANQDVQYIPLTEQENQELRESFTEDEQKAFQEFFNALSTSLQSITETEVFGAVQKMFESRNTSLNIVLQLIPTKAVKTTEIQAISQNKEEQTFSNN